MQSPCLHLSKNYGLGFQFSRPYSNNLFSSSSSLTFKFPNTKSVRRLITQSQNRPSNGQNRKKPKQKVTAKGKKENVWSIDNEVEKASSEKDRTKHRRRKGKRGVVRSKTNKLGRILVSGAMLMEVETVLQTQEPVIKPAWNTFASSVSGIWKGVGGVFSPISAEMEPIDIGKRDENLYDCYMLTRVEAVLPPSGKTSEIHRKINWVTLNPHGEVPEHIGVSTGNKKESRVENATLPLKEKANDGMVNHVLPTFESFDLETSDVMEEDVMGNEPGLVYFEV